MPFFCDPLSDIVLSRACLLLAARVSGLCERPEGACVYNKQSQNSRFCSWNGTVCSTYLHDLLLSHCPPLLLEVPKCASIIAQEGGGEGVDWEGSGKVLFSCR